MVTGFEPVDILQGICMLVRMVVEGNPRSTTPTVAASMPTAILWRASWSSRYLSRAIPRGAGWDRLRLRDSPFVPEFSHFDASMRFDVSIEPTVEPRGCRCGDVLRGAITPSDCPLFDHACTPGSIPSAPAW